jgi:hypothetical protein
VISNVISKIARRMVSISNWVPTNDSLYWCMLCAPHWQYGGRKKCN